VKPCRKGIEAIYGPKLETTASKPKSTTELTTTIPTTVQPTTPTIPKIDSTNFSKLCKSEIRCWDLILNDFRARVEIPRDGQIYPSDKKIIFFYFQE